MSDALKPGKKYEDLTMKAYHAIQELLFKNEFLPGQQLNSRNLGKTFKMSPTPVTQALKLLHFQGFLAHVPNKGYTLEKNTIQQVEEIFKLRLAIEPFCMETILDRIDKDGWKKLYAALEAHKDALKKNLLNKILLSDITFHITMARISLGEIGANMVKYLFEMLYLKNRPAILYTSPNGRFATHHEEILQYLERSDAQGAKKYLTEHIQSVQENLISNMKENLEDLTGYFK